MCDPASTDGLKIRMEILHPTFLRQLIFIRERSYKEHSKLLVHQNTLPNGPKYCGISEENNRNSCKINKYPVESEDKKLEISEKKRKKLKYTFEEMVHFERRFLETLRILKVISDEVNSRFASKENSNIREIFRDIPSLFQLHQLICQSLDELNPDVTGNLLPSAFVNDKEIPFLNIYKSFMCRYANNYPALVSHWNKDKDFATLCRNIVQTSKYEEQKIQDVCGMYFGVHCSLTRFRLLFTKLEEAMDPDDKNMDDVKKALKVLSDLLQISEGEVLRQDKISDAQLAFAKIDGREMNFRHIPPLLREGPCKKIPRRSSHKRNLDRHLFLFAGYLVITEAANAIGRYQVKSELLLAGMHLTKVSEDDEISTPHCFRIKATELCVELAFANEAEKSDWWDAIQAAISEERDRKDSIVPMSSLDKTDGTTATSAAEWVKDEQSTMCAECYTEFTVLNRRHHCRACGKVFCGSCSAYRAPIAYLGGKVKRVCVIDYYLIHGDMKPPTAAIMEGILRRTQKESASIETGYLYWCVYAQGVWNSRSLVRNHKPSSHKNLLLNVDQLSALPSTASLFFPVDKKGTVAGSGEQSAKIDRPDSANEKPSCDDIDNNNNNKTNDNADVSGSAEHLTFGRAAMSIYQSISKGINISTEALSGSKKTGGPALMSIYLGRIFCVLQADTLLAMYAARADSRAKDQLPLLGTRLFYLDHVSDTPDTICSESGQQISLPVANDRLPTGIPTPPESSLTKSSSQASLASTSATGRVTPSLSRSSSSAVSTSDSSEEHLVRPSDIRAGNPLYRNHKPPDRPIKPKHLREVVRALHDIADGHVIRMAGQLECARKSTNHTTDDSEQTKPINSGSRLSSSSSSTNRSSSVGFAESETIQQLNSISPLVVGVLQNNLGFLLLPMNTDCLAHYFEAPTYEIRTKWINAIRQTCIDYLNK